MSGFFSSGAYSIFRNFLSLAESQPKGGKIFSCPPLLKKNLLLGHNSQEGQKHTISNLIRGIFRGGICPTSRQTSAYFHKLLQW
jgi:hypothetical protein